MNQFNENLLRRVGGWHLIIIIAICQVLGLLGAVPGFISLQLTADFSEDLNQLFSLLTPILIITSQIVLLGLSWFITKNARERITQWSKETKTEDDKVEIAAWKEITNLTTIYGIGAFIAIFLIVILPPFVITQLRGDTVESVFQPTGIASPVPIYILLAGLASTLGYIVLTLLLIERFALPDRLILLPKDFESQISGRTGALLGTKFNTLILSLIVIGLAIMAPVGYQQVIRILYSEISSFQVFSDLQFQSFLLSGLVLVLGVIFSMLATRSISEPVTELIDIFQKIEAGDLSLRAPVTGTDELATVAMHFNHMVSRLDTLQATLEEQVVERTKQLQATNEVGRVASSILDPDELLQKVANLITERFGYYYAAIYLLDASGKWAELREATGSSGQVLKKNRHRLETAGNSMVAGCIRERMPRISQNAVEEEQRFANPLLPYTRSELALPLTVGDRVLGALNVQSTKPDDFDADAIDTMQSMASQVAVSLESAHLYQEAQQSITELRAIQKQYLLEGWTNIKSHNDELEYSIGDSVDADKEVLESPISLRDQTLGQITLKHSKEWSPEQKSLVDAVTAQAAIALENARLVSESRQVALRERTLAEINSKIWASSSTDAILQTVVKELGKRLGTSNATIELNMDDEA